MDNLPNIFGCRLPHVIKLLLVCEGEFDLFLWPFANLIPEVCILSQVSVKIFVIEACTKNTFESFYHNSKISRGIDKLLDLGKCLDK